MPAPPERPDHPEHQSRRPQRLVFGEDAGLYDRSRPSYPAELIDDVVSLAGTDATTLDVGCGTGKATVLLAERGTAGVGVEADGAMAAVARHNLAAFPSWRVDVSDFETWAPGERGPGSFDLVCSAQAWHWLDPDVRFHKAYGLLRPGGWVALWWNRPSGGSPEALAGEVGRIYAELAPEIAAKNSLGRRALEPPHEDVPAGLDFGPPRLRRYLWEKEYSAGDWVSLLRTQSDHRLLPPERLDELTRRAQEAIEASGGLYRHNYACWLWAAQKLH